MTTSNTVRLDMTISTALQAAANAGMIHLSEAGQAVFVNALLQPPPISPALERGLARHEKLLRTKSEALPHRV